LVQLWDREAARARAASAQLLKDSPVLEDRIRSWLSSTVADATSANILNLLSGSSEEAIRSRVYAQLIKGIQTIAQILQDEFELPDDTAVAVVAAFSILRAWPCVSDRVGRPTLLVG